MPRRNSLVLIVLDDPTESASIRGLLEGNDYHVAAASRFKDAASGLDGRVPDLVITGIDPLRTESETVLELVGRGTRHVPVLAVGGVNQGEKILDALEAGADFYIENPGDELQILARAAKLLERRQARQLMDAGEDFFRSLTDGVADIISILSFDGTIVFESASVESILGYTQEQIIGKNAFDFVHPEDRERVSRYFYENAVEHGRLIVPIEYRYRDAAGAWRVLESVGKVMMHPTRGLIAVVNSRDVTERRRSENTLRDSEEKFRLVLDNSLDIIYQINLRTRSFDYTSRAVKGVTGFEPEEFVNGGYPFVQSLIHPDDLEPIKKAFDEAVKNVPLGICEHSIEYRFNTKHRGWRWFRENRALLVDNSSQPYAIIATARDVTDQKTVEANLHLQKTLLESQTEGSMDGILSFDSRGIVISHNRRVVEMLKHPEKNLIGQHYLELQTHFLLMIESEERRGVFIDKVRVLAHNAEAVDRDEFKLTDGRYIESYSVPITDADGEHYGRVSYLRDITAPKAIEVALRESEDRYRDIVENADEIICTHDLTGKVLTSNKKFSSILQFDNKSVDGIQLQDILVPKYRSKFDDYLLEISSKGAASGSMFVKNANGETRVWEYNNTLRTEGVAEPIVRAMAVDVTERRRAEEQLRESEERFRNLADTAPVQIWISGTDKVLSYANKTLLDFTGNTLENEIHHGWRSIHPDDLAEARRIYHDAFELRVSYNLEYRHLRADGVFRWMLLIGVPRWTAGGEFLGYIGSSIDITERREAEENLRKTEEKLRQAQKLESVGRLAGGIAHDFNNMLTAIIGYSDISIAKIPGDDPLRRNLEEIRKAAERSASLTSQLLAFSRQQVLKPRIVDFNQMVGETVKMLGRLIGENIALDVRLDPRVGTIEADPAQLTQVIVNLAVNARDAMPNGGRMSIVSEKLHYNESLPINPELNKTGWLVLLTVSDTGVGIEPEHLPNVFEPFYTTKEIGKGTGLGLATVYGIVKQSSGEIFVESEPGVGTTFKIYFPCLSIKETSDLIMPRNEMTSKGTETILIVEDEEMVRELARNILEVEGYKIETAVNGREAYDLCVERKGAFDLVVTDVVMPQMSGLEFAREIKKIYPNLPILFTSGYTDDKGFLDEIRASNIDFLGKPFVVETLVGKVRNFLDQCGK